MIIRIPFYRLFLTLLSLSAVTLISGQTVVTELDSIPVVKPKIRQNIYKFNDFGAKEIQFEDKRAVLVKDPETSKLNGLGSIAFTSLTGLNSSSSKEGYWEVSGLIQGNDTLPAWQITLFCEGYLEKQRERVRNDDGSWSVSTDQNNVFFWEKDSYGIILEGPDTIGFFGIKMKISDDELMKEWHSFIFPDKNFSQLTGYKKNSWIAGLAKGKDYEIRGKFHDTDFLLIQTGFNRKAWIFIDESLAGMFQGDLDYPGVTKKHRNSPYLMINKVTSAGERRNIFRLAVTSRFINEYLSKF